MSNHWSMLERPAAIAYCFVGDTEVLVTRAAALMELAWYWLMAGND
jgi:hypothetical protein